MPLRAAILDVDGTLIDSNDAHARAWVEAFAEAGHDVAFERVRPLIGEGGDRLLPDASGIDPESDEGRRLSDRSGEIFLERHLESCRPFPHVRALLERMQADGLKLVVATSASEDELEPLLERAGIADLIDRATNADDVDESKPAPDVVEAALAQAGCDADEAVMLGDTPYDVVAATKAGVRIVAVRCGGWWSDDDFDGAAAIYDDPADLLRHYARSAFGEA